MGGGCKMEGFVHRAWRVEGDSREVMAELEVGWACDWNKYKFCKMRWRKYSVEKWYHEESRKVYGGF